MKKLIVTRHPAAIEFIRQNLLDFQNAEVLIGNVTPDQIRGAHVAGVLPLHLAAVADRVSTIVFDNPPRGNEYSLDDMIAAGARIETFVVRPIEHYEMLIRAAGNDAAYIGW